MTIPELLVKVIEARKEVMRLNCAHNRDSLSLAEAAFNHAVDIENARKPEFPKGCRDAQGSTFDRRHRR